MSAGSPAKALREAPSSLPSVLEAFLAAERQLGARGPWVVAFSGGGDSTALAAGLAELAPRHGIELHLLHVDHALDPGSGRRAAGAAAIAAELGLLFTSERHAVPERAQRSEGSEAAARRVRYAALEAFRLRIGADRILTAHHCDDQVETLLLRIAAGSGLAGLQGIQRRRGAILRPLLDLDRTVLDAFVTTKGIDPLADPTNRDLTIERNRVRHRLWPLLERQEPGLGSALVAVAAAAGRALRVLDSRLEKLLVRQGGSSQPRLEIAALLPFRSLCLSSPWASSSVGQAGKSRGRRGRSANCSVSWRRRRTGVMRCLRVAATASSGRPPGAFSRSLSFPPPRRTFHIFWRRRERSKFRRFAAVSGSPDSRLHPGCAPASAGARRSHSPGGPPGRGRRRREGPGRGSQPPARGPDPLPGCTWNAPAEGTVDRSQGATCGAQ